MSVVVALLCLTVFLSLFNPPCLCIACFSYSFDCICGGILPPPSIYWHTHSQWTFHTHRAFPSMWNSDDFSGIYKTEFCLHFAYSLHWLFCEFVAFWLVRVRTQNKCIISNSIIIDKPKFTIIFGIELVF